MKIVVIDGTGVAGAHSGFVRYKDHMPRHFAFIMALPLATGLWATDRPFQRLFDGKTLNGWEVCNGSANYRAEKGEIVGTTAEGSPNSFLCTRKEYGDFVLDFETRTDPALNSGVQIRSHRYKANMVVHTFDGKNTTERKQPAGRVHGYQVEVANEQIGGSGGIYEEGRRGWLNQISPHSPCAKAFKDNQWNRYRVVASGDSVKTWVNGVACADMVDPVDPSGFIALQVHAVKAGSPPMQVRWRNIAIADLGRHEWKPLWDGRTLEGWTKSGGGTWTIEDGAIHGVTEAGGTKHGFLISNTAYKDFTARVRFKILRGNSGFFVRANKDTLAGYEVEIDHTKRTGGFWEVGGRNWVTGPEDNAGVVKDGWNELTASLHGHRIVFHLNGIKTVDLPDDVNGTPGPGHIALQVHGRHGTDIFFKDIAILAPAKE